MNCRTAEEMVNQYMNHTLSIEEMEEFLDHIQSCSSCYDELETYFIVHEAMQQLDEDEDGKLLDFKKLLEQEIRRTRRNIHQKRVMYFVTGLLCVCAAIALCVFAILVIFS